MNLSDLILCGDFLGAQKRIGNELSHSEFESQILAKAFEQPSITFYGFLCMLNQSSEKAEIHYYLSLLMSTALCHLPGGYQVGFYHCQRAIDLAPDNIDYKKDFLLYFDIPDKLLSLDQAKKIARSILEVDPRHLVSQKIMRGH